MLIVITANGTRLESQVTGNFLRCRYFIFYDTDAREIVDVADNPALEVPEEGGQAAAQLIVERDVESLLTGEIDPEAGDLLAAGGVRASVCTGCTVREAVELFMSGDLEERAHANRGLYPGPGSPETPHSREPSPGSDPGRESANEEVIGPEPECICVVCGETVPECPGMTCDLMRCPRCNAEMIRHLKVE